MDNEVTIVVKARDETDSAFARIASKARNLKAKIDLDVDIDRDRLAGRLIGVLGSIGSAASQAAGGALSGLASTIGMLGPVAVAAAAGMAALAAAAGVIPGLIMAVAAAAAAAIPAIAGLGAVGAVLKIGFGGITNALSAYGKAVGGAGGGSSGAAGQMRAAARQILAAEEALSEAKRRAVRASQEVTRAREREIERLEDLRLAIRGAALEQEDATLGLAKAQERYAELQRQQAENELTDRLALTGVQRERFNISPTDVREAELAIRQAQLRLDEAKESAGDLAQEQAKAARVGVEGSEQVQQALENQRQANLAVTQAARQLQYAHEDAAQAIGGGGGAAGGIDQFAEAMKKLSPNARELVYALLKIKERFNDIKMAVQDRLLEGFAEGVTKLANRWLPTLGQLLPEIAGKLNRVGLELMDALGQPEFVENISAAVRGFGRVIDRLRPALTGLVDTFGDLAKAATPTMEKLADKLAGAVEDFSAWIDKASEDGSLARWFEKAEKAATNLWEIMKESFGVLKDLYDIIFGESEGEPLKGPLDGLKRLRKWIKDNEESIRNLVDAIKWFGSAAASALRGVGNAIGFVRRGFNDFMSMARRARRDYENWGRGIRDWTMRFFGGAGSWLYTAGRNLVTGLINGIRSVIPSLRSATNLVGAIAGGIGGLFAHGGIIGAASGGARSGLTMVGEHGRELVKLPAGSQVYGNEATERMMAGGGGGSGPLQVQIQFSGNTDSAFATAFMKMQQAGLLTFKAQYVRG